MWEQKNDNIVCPFQRPRFGVKGGDVDVFMFHKTITFFFDGVVRRE